MTKSFTTCLLNDLNEMQSEVLFAPVDPSRILEVHPSALPYCPNSFLLSFNLDLLNRHKFSGQAIMNQGTALHSTMDRFFGRMPRAFGDFVCRSCGCIHHLKQASDFPDFLCPTCGAPLEYSEVYINHKGFVGHVDMLYNIGTKEKPELWIIDFKSKTFSLVDKAKANEIPLNYHYQTLAYTLLLRAQYGLKIKGRAILNICRDLPSKMSLAGVHRWTRDDLILGHTALLEQRDLFNFMINCKSYEEWMDNIGVQHCPNSYCPYCTTYDDQDLQKLIQQKFKEMNGRSISEIVKEHYENHNQ